MALSASWEQQSLLVLEHSFIIRISTKNLCPGNWDSFISKESKFFVFCFFSFHFSFKAFFSLHQEITESYNLSLGVDHKIHINQLPDYIRNTRRSLRSENHLSGFWFDGKKKSLFKRGKKTAQTSPFMTWVNILTLFSRIQLTQSPITDIKF